MSNNQQPEILLNIEGEILNAENFVPPEDRNYRSAWVRSGGMIVVDMDKAKIIHANRIVEAADKKLVVLAQEITLRNAVGDALGTLPQEVQALRAAKTIDLSGAATPEELQAIWPEILGELPTA